MRYRVEVAKSAELQLEELYLWVVELRYFGDLSIEETAAFLNVAPATVKRHWSFARAWLYRALSAS